MPPARKREPIVPQKVRDAVDHIFTTPGATLQSTAAHIGWTTRKLRFYMTQPHVLRWLLTEKQARLEAASAGNIGALWGLSGGAPSCAAPDARGIREGDSVNITLALSLIIGKWGQHDVHCHVVLGATCFRAENACPQKL
jgi:hypothetical protein